jgi:hypothetical protein
MKFSQIVAEEFPRRAIRVRVGNTESYMGIHSRGLNDMTPEQVHWLDSHNCIHCWYSYKEVEIIYRKSAKYDKIVWG